MFKDKGVLKAVWAGMFLICCVLGFWQNAAGAGKVVLVILSLLFFVPAYADVYFAWKNKDRKELRIVRTLCLLSLGSTLVVLVANMLSVLSRSEALGTALYYVLAVVSTPMLCGQYWVYSLLLWAVLLWCCIAALHNKKTR